MKKNYILIWLLLITTSFVSVSQSNSLVYIKNGEFINDCNIWTPKILNYSIRISKLPDNSTIISPSHGAFNSVGPLVCSTAADGIARIKADFQYMKDLNIDAVRITGLELDADNIGDFTVLIKDFPTSASYGDDYFFDISVATNQNKLIEYIETALDIATEFDIKVILLTGRNSHASADYLNYLTNLATRLKNHSALFAYDLYNEPTYKSSLRNKADIYDLSSDWYSTIRNAGDNHLITLGNLTFTDIFTWDPHILKVDFYSFHIYPDNISDFKIHTKWFNLVCNKPWIIGEIGKAAHDNTLCELAVSELEQKDFAMSTINTTFDCNGKAYSWWKYHDDNWCNDLNPPCRTCTCQHNYVGIIKNGRVDGLAINTNISPILTTETSNPLYSIEGSPKPLAIAFKNYVYSNNVCDKPNDYYTAFSGDKSVQAYTGTVMSNNIPIANAVIHAWYQINNEYYNTYTFSDNNGNFAIYPKNSYYGNSLSIEVSYPGMDVISHKFTDHTPKAIVLSNLGYDVSSYFTNELDVSSGANETWLEDKKNVSQLTVNNNAVLTIKSNIYMLPQGKIIIKPGGKLIIDGGTLTSSCDEMWQGILIQGDENLNQSDETNQGVLEMKNGASIENAEVAVYVGNYFVNNGSGVVTNNFGGGIVKLSGATFYNNQKDIVFRPYELWSTTTQKPIPQVSYIENCTLKFDVNMLHDPVLNQGKQGCIHANHIHGLNIKGNTFINQDNSLLPNERATAIELVNSSISITPYCNPQISPCTSQPNQFINLHYGIVASNGLATNDLIDIRENTFTNTYRSIFLSGTNNAKVLLNNIQVPNQAIAQAGQPDPGAPYGIYLDGGKGFRVEENTLWRPSSNGPEIFNGARGIIVHNTGGVNNEIYKNTTTNLFISEQAQGFNSGKGTNATKGLKYLCNTSNTSSESYDNYVFGGFTVDIYGMHWSGISLDQKQSNLGNSQTPYLPAGNTFSASHSSSSIPVDFDNTHAQKITYSWGSVNGVTAPLEPTKYSNIEVKVITGSHDACPSKISNGGNGSSLTSLYQNLYTAQLAYNSSKLLYDIWANGGISNMEQQVETTEPWEVYQQFNSLLAESPDLTPEVMIEIIRNSNFTSLMVKLLMLANPDLKDRMEVMQELERRLPPLPQTYIDEINNQVATTTQIRLLEGNMASDYHLLESIGEEIKYNYKTNTEDSWAKDSLIAFISRMPDIFDKYELAATYLSYGEYDNMTGVLNEIPSNFELNDEMNVELNNFTTLCNMVKTLDEAGLYENGLTDEQRMEAQTILESNLPMLSSMALAILKRDNPNLEYFEIIKDVEENNLRIAHGDNNITAPAEAYLFSVYPNPAINFVTLKYDCRYANMNYNITDMSGKTLLTGELKTIANAESIEVIIDLGSLSPGSYTLEVRAKGLALWSQKLVINN